MTLQKTKLIRNLFLACFFVFGIILIFGYVENSCSTQHLMIINELKSFETSQNYEVCDTLNSKIDLFNEKCEPQIEILDCG